MIKCPNCPENAKGHKVVNYGDRWHCHGCGTDFEA